jgi:hypothetical protein
MFSYTHGAMNFTPALAIRKRVANICTMCAGDGWLADFSKNFRASLSSKGLSNEPNLGRIHLSRQYL